MYTFLFFLFLAVSAFLIYRGIKLKNTGLIVLGALVAGLTFLVSWFLGFWSEKLWFDQLGYHDRFWTVWLTRIYSSVGAFIVGGLIVFLLTFSLKGSWQRLIRYAAVATGAVVSSVWINTEWEIILMFMNRVGTSVADPILNMNTGFYLFTLPFLKMTYATVLFLVAIAFAAALLVSFSPETSGGKQNFILREGFANRRSMYLSGGILLIILGIGKYLDRFSLLYSQSGIVTGPGWTDVNIRMPALFVIAVITVLGGLILMIPSARKGITGLFVSRERASRLPGLYVVPSIVFSLWLIGLAALPGLLQWLKVEPNEITVERPYIENNIEFTRYAFKLDQIIEDEFPVSDQLTSDMISMNQSLFNNIRLWDYRALDAVFKQFQEIRLYYEFTDVDIDRYMIGDSYSQVMISAREMEAGNLPIESQTFVNKRFKYTHGYGLALNRVSEFTPEGLPNLLVRDIPPVSQYDELTVTRPEIYYGELTDEFVIVNSKEEEFDYPSGESNVYSRYEGQGGVEITGTWRKFLYGSRFGGTRLFLSGYPEKGSRIMFHRQITDRIKTLAPFLTFDDDPYIVLDNGKMFWMVDAYTTSRYYPYSEPFTSAERIGYEQGNVERSTYGKISGQLHGKNYVRNSVKITIDAYSGEVNFYVFEKEDPILEVYRNIFPEMMKDRSEMPKGLESHIRYPADMLLIQGLMYAKYHMTDPAVFYNQEDLWVRATEKYYNNVQPVEPYYIMWEQPGSDRMEFALILPFTPKNKQVMIGWMAGLCDGDNYGKLMAYKFPKEKMILGPQQVETKIDQDSFLSGQLTLWDQRGSNVIRGNLLAIPVDNTLIYVEPIYLMSETSAYPELRLVAVMHNDNLSYAGSFEEALKGLYSQADLVASPAEGEGGVESDIGTMDLIERAGDAFDSYLDLMQQKKFREAAEALEQLQRALERLRRQ